MFFLKKGSLFKQPFKSQWKNFFHTNHAPVTLLQLLLLERNGHSYTHCCQVTSNTQHAHVVHTVNRQKHKKQLLGSLKWHLKMANQFGTRHLRKHSVIQHCPFPIITLPVGFCTRGLFWANRYNWHTTRTMCYWTVKVCRMYETDRRMKPIMPISLLPGIPFMLHPRLKKYSLTFCEIWFIAFFL